MDIASGPSVEVAGTAPAPAAGPPAGLVVVRLVGTLSASDAGPDGGGTADAVVALLAEHRHVVADLSGTRITHPAAVGCFAAALGRAGSWPRVTLDLAAPGPELAAALTDAGVDRRVPVHPDMEQAVAHAGARPDLVSVWWPFPPDPRTPARARTGLRRACAAWGVDDDTREAAEIVVTELVTNAVEHAVSPSVVEVRCTEDRLWLSVHDLDPRALPPVAVPATDSPRGRGLAMVDAVSREWGVEVSPHGKTVWSELARRDAPDDAAVSPPG